MLNKCYNDREEKKKKKTASLCYYNLFHDTKRKVERKELLTLIVNALDGSKFISLCNHSDINVEIKSISIDWEKQVHLQLNRVFLATFYISVCPPTHLNSHSQFGVARVIVCRIHLYTVHV